MFTSGDANPKQKFNFSCSHVHRQELTELIFTKLQGRVVKRKCINLKYEVNQDLNVK